MKRPFAILLFCLSAGLLALPVHGREVKAGFYRYGNYHLLDKKGTYSGFGYELYELLARTAGWTNRFIGVDRPCEDMAKLVGSGEVDILDCVRKTPDREKIYEYSALPSGYCCGYIIVRSDENRFAERDYANWGRVSVGFIAGGSIGEDFRNFAALHGIGLDGRGFRDEDKILSELRAGNLDMAVVHSTFYTESEEFRIVGEFSLKPCYFCVKKGNKALMAEIDRAMAAMYQDNPAWYVELKRRYLQMKDVVVYLPRCHAKDEVHIRYLKATAYLLAAIGNWNPVFRSCADDFSDADFSIPSIAAHVYRTPENLRRFDFPLVPACRRPIYLARDPGAERQPSSGPLRIGYDRSEPEWLKCFLSYARNRNIAYKLVSFDSSEELGKATLSHAVDLAISGVDPKGGLQRVEECGSVEFDFATPKTQPALRLTNDMATRYMRYHEGALMRKLEKYAYGITDIGRVVRVGVYAEFGAIDIAEDGTISGFIADYLREVARHRNWDLIFVPMTYSEAFECLAAGEVDLVAASSYYPEVSDAYDKTKRDAGMLRYALKVKSDSKILPNRPDLWDGNRIGYLAGSKAVDELSRYLDGIGARHRLIPYTGIQDARNDVRNGKLDGIFTLHARESRDFRTIAVFPAVHSYFCISRRRPEIKRDLDEVMDYFASNNIDFNWWLSNFYLRGSRDVLMLDAGEIEFVKRHRGRKVVVGLPETVDPVARFDEKTGKASGFLAALFRCISEKSGLEFEFTGKGRADVYAAQHESLGDLGDFVFAREWFPLPSVQVSLPADRIPDSARGIWAAETKRTDEIEYLRQCNHEVLECDSPEACYRAVAEGRAEATIDNFGTARLMIDQHREFANLQESRIDPARWARQVSIAFPPEAEPELRSIMIKARTSISASTADKMFVDAIVECRQDRFSYEDIIFYGIITGLLVVVLLGIGYAFMYAKRQHALAQERTRFFFNVSHDVRTPVHAIMGFVDMCLSDLDDRNKVKDYLIKAKAAGGLLLSLIKSVLDMSRLEAGKVKIEETVGDIYLSFIEIEPTLRELAEEKGIELTFDFGEVANRYVYADYEMCSRVFVNIIANAIKYTKEGGFVKVRCEQIGETEEMLRGGEAERCGRGATPPPTTPPLHHTTSVATYRYTFQDNGIGMSEKFQKRLYDKFSRENNTTMSGVSGLGLGMSIVKSFVALLGGRIECRSKLGEGTTFTVELPFRVQEGRQWVDPLTGAVRDKDRERGSDDVTSARKPVSFTGKKALLVDDSKLNREVACYYLKQAGFEVETAENGQEAVDKVRGRSYDIVLMDMQMPVMDGVEATREIRMWEKSEQGSGSRVPIIAWTANAFDDDIKTALDAGMDGHVAKGVKSSALVETLSRFV